MCDQPLKPDLLALYGMPGLHFCMTLLIQMLLLDEKTTRQVDYKRATGAKIIKVFRQSSALVPTSLQSNHQ